MGSNGDVSFEKDMFLLMKQKCKIFSFDKDNQNLHLFKPFNGTFNPWRIGDKTEISSNVHSIEDIMKKFGHEKVEFLKIDIEGIYYSFNRHTFVLSITENFHIFR